MEKSRKKKGESQGPTQMLLPLLGVLATVKGALLELVIGSGFSVLQALLLEQEREQICGARYWHDPTRKASRAGYADEAELVFGGRRVRVKRPRARSRDGKEVPLPTLQRIHHHARAPRSVMSKSIEASRGLRARPLSQGDRLR